MEVIEIDAIRDQLEREARHLLSEMVADDGTGIKVKADDWQEAFAALHAWADERCACELAQLGIIEFRICSDSVIVETHDFISPLFDPFCEDPARDGYDGNAVLTLETDGDNDFDGCPLGLLAYPWREFGVPGEKESIRVWPGVRYDQPPRFTVKARFNLEKAYREFVDLYEEDNL